MADDFINNLARNIKLAALPCHKSMLYNIRGRKSVQHDINYKFIFQQACAK